jgi:hypothetical protein
MTHPNQTNRRDPILTTSKTGEVVPEYFQSDNPKLIQFLDAYLDFLDSDGTHGFGHKIKDVIHTRDISETSLLDEIIKEIGDGLQASSFFAQPRLMAKLLADFYRTKGTLVSAEGFFRGFFNEEVSIEYPKKNIFIVGTDNIGFDSQRFIQDNKLYQVFSILIKVGISTQDYESLYKKFVHPAGFHFAGQVASVGEAIFPFAGESPNPLDSADTDPVFEAEGNFILATPFSDLTAFIDSGSVLIRTDVDQSIEAFEAITAQSLSNFYGSLSEITDPNSFTFDDSSNASRPDFSMTLETMDNFSFDSNIN